MRTIRIKFPSFGQVDFKIEIVPEDIAVRGNLIDTGDPIKDKAYEDDVINRLNTGNTWAWCQVLVKASWRGMSGYDSLGACSYRDCKNFMITGPYNEMQKASYDDLVNRIYKLKS